MKRTMSNTVTRRTRISNSPSLRAVLVRQMPLVFALWTMLFLSNSTSADDTKIKRDPLLVRVPDDRPRIDPKDFQSLGIRVHESKHVRLFTDVTADVSELPFLMDQAFDEFEKYFGPILPAADVETFQVNGYLIKNQETFKKAGLVRDQLNDHPHGVQKGYQFWMMDQATDYYRRHLMLHEMTHCFMLANPRINVPLAYLEGMAEHFGTHRVTSDGKLSGTRLMPHNREDFRGHDRLFLIRQDVKSRGAPGLIDVMHWEQPAFKFFHESYPWAWGTCLFLDQHPRTCERFQKLARSLMNPQAWKKFEQQFEPDKAEIQTEWMLFANEAFEGFDFTRMAIDFRDGQPLKDLIRTGKNSHRAEVRADRGWQSSGIVVEKGHQYELVASGQFTLADKPKPWISEANGITYRYHNGRPLGQLIAAIRSTSSTEGEPESMLKITGLSSKSRLDATTSGTLYLRLNDHPAELADNNGTVSIEVREVE